MQIQGQKQELRHCEGTLHTFCSKLGVYYGTTINFEEFLSCFGWIKSFKQFTFFLGHLWQCLTFTDFWAQLKNNVLDCLRAFWILLLHHTFVQWIPQRLDSTLNQHPFWVNQFFSTAAGFRALRHRGSHPTHKQDETKTWAETWCSSTVFQLPFKALNWKSTGRYKHEQMQGSKFYLLNNSIPFLHF